MKGILIFLFIVVGGYFFVMKVVDESNSYEDRTISEDGHTSYYRKKVEDKDKKYHIKDSLGQVVFNGAGLSLAEKKDIWSRSPLKAEMINKFPKFNLMKIFVKDRVEDADLQKAILNQIEKVQDKMMSGSINSNDAKYELGLLE
jgi:hypothetical protein